jgi:peptidyl-tRNA hydrolase
MRKNFNFPEGLFAAQTAHAGDQWMRTRLLKGKMNDSLEDTFTEEEMSWMKDPYIAVLSVDALEELQILRDEAKEQGLEVAEWHDWVPSKNLKRPIKVFVGISIGPADSDAIKAITGNLGLY